MIKKFKSFIPYVKGSYFLTAISLVCALLATGSKLFIPFLAGKCVNEMENAIKNAAFSELDLSNYFIAMASLLIVGTLFRYIFDYITYLIGQRVIKNIRNELFKATLDSPISAIDQSRKGDLLLRLVNDVENVQTGLVSGFAAFYDGVIAILITLVFMFTLNWILGLVVVCLTPISIFVSRFVSKFNSKHFRKQRSAQGMVNAFASESLTNSEAVATLNIAKDRVDQFDKLSDEFRNSTFKANLGASTINPSTRLVNALINGALVLVGAVLIINNTDGALAYLGLGSFAIGDLSAFLTYASSYMQPFNEISNVVSEIDYALASFQRIDETIHGKKDVNNGKKVIDGTFDDLKAKNITFSYDGKRTIIKDFSLDIFKGHKIAFVGPTGCGKTTLINLLMRFYDPQNGSFYVNGESTVDLEKSAFRSHIGMVLQDTWIFNGTVFENIAYAKEGATREEVEEAARKAQASHFIERLPQGYDTKISDSSGLSVGEKQLICVARVMLLEPEIVILDEATSNIDVRTEKLLSEAFDKLMEGKTSLVVAHRLSTIVSSDLIVVLKDGEIIETGNHKELIAKHGFYYNLYNAQFN